MEEENQTVVAGDNTAEEAIAPTPEPAEQTPPPAASEPDLDQLIADFERETAQWQAAQPQQPEQQPTAPPSSPEPSPSEQFYQKKLLDDALDKEFDRWTAEWQDRLPEGSRPDTFAKEAKLAVLENPELLAAFQAQYVHRINPADAVREYNMVQTALRSGYVPPDKWNDAQRRLQDLSIAARAPQLLTQTARRIVDAEHKASRWQFDEEATADRAAVAQAMRGTVSDAEMPAPTQPDLSRMSDAEFRDYVEREYRYSPPV